MARKSSIQGLYYITHINNIPSILEKGILSHELIEAENIPYQTIYNLQVVSHRSHKEMAMLAKQARSVAGNG